MKAGPESKIRLSCCHWVKDMADAVFLEINEPDGKEYGYYCKPCADAMIKEGHARKPNTNNERVNTKDG